MATWKANWEFRNCMLRQNGRHGEKTVQAENLDHARRRIRNDVSRDLFGTTAYQIYVKVLNLHKVSSGY